MFDFLHDAPVSRAISGTYYAIRLIRHRHEIIDVQTGLSVEGLESEPSSLDQALAVQIVESIQEAELSSLEQLNDATAEEYVAELANIAQRLALTEFGFDKEKAEELLEQFREPISEPRAAGGNASTW